MGQLFSPEANYVISLLNIAGALDKMYTEKDPGGVEREQRRSNPRTPLHEEKRGLVDDSIGECPHFFF
jgi:hypothetical protein